MPEGPQGDRERSLVQESLRQVLDLFGIKLTDAQRGMIERIERREDADAILDVVKIAPSGRKGEALTSALQFVLSGKPAKPQDRA
jgi:hypothetical protein